MTGNNSLEQQLIKLEERLLEPETRKSETELGVLLADDFVEFASSGQAYDKAQIIAALQNSTPTRFALSDFKAVLLAPDVALATFRISRDATRDRPAADSLRSSVWKRTEGRWRMVFHQGTLCGRK